MAALNASASVEAPLNAGSMADLQTLHTQAKKLTLTIRAGLERLEMAEQVLGHFQAGALCSLSFHCLACLLGCAFISGMDCWLHVFLFPPLFLARPPVDCCNRSRALACLQNSRAIVPTSLAAELQQQLQQLQASTRMSAWA